MALKPFVKEVNHIIYWASHLIIKKGGQFVDDDLLVSFSLLQQPMVLHSEGSVCSIVAGSYPMFRQCCLQRSTSSVGS
jgi:hypothetical protein